VGVFTPGGLSILVLVSTILLFGNIYKAMRFDKQPNNAAFGTGDAYTYGSVGVLVSLPHAI